MTAALNILVIEDNRADFLLIMRHLKECGLPANCSCVDDRDSLARLFEGGSWDVILFDYNLPNLDFHESFVYLRRLVPDLPVILVSGSIGEDQAVDLLMLGVSDFVLKHNLSRLVPAIERTLQELAERRGRLAAEAGLRERELRFKSLFEKSPIAIGLGDGESSKLIEVNEAWLRLFGYQRPEVIGRSALDLGLYVRGKQREEIIRIVTAGGCLVNEAVQMRRKSGEILDILYSAEMITLDSRPCLQVMLTDVTDQKRTFAAIMESERRHRSLFDNMLEGYASCRMIFDGEGRPEDFVYLDVNKAFGELTGLNGVVGRRASEVIPGIREDNRDLLEHYGRVARTGQSECFETFVPALGIWFSISVYGAEQGSFIAVFNNVTARKNAEAAQEATIGLLRICNEAQDLRELMSRATAFFQELTACEAVGIRLRDGDDFPYFETAGFPEEFVRKENSLCAFDAKGGVLRDADGQPLHDCMCGNILCSRFDSSKPFFTPHGSFWSSCTTRLLAETSPTDRQARTRNRCNGEGYESVALVPLRHRGETYGLFQFNDRRVGRFSAEKIAQYENLVDYISIAFSKLRSDQALLESNRVIQLTTERLQLATASGHLGIWEWDVADGALVWDARMYEIYGVLGASFPGIYRAWEQSLHPEDRATALVALQSALDGETPYDQEFRIQLPNGGVKHIKANGIVIRDSEGAPLRMIGINQDVTERNHLEEQLLQSQKMEAVGLLAGGIAHDFNNILTAIIGYGTLFQMEMADDDPQRANVGEILAAADRAADLTGSLLAFSRKQVIKPRPVNLNQIITKTGKFLRRIIGEDIELKTGFGQEMLTVNVDAGQIEQVLMNLATNARDAMPGGGILSIETEQFSIDAGFIASNGYGVEGDYAHMMVSDTGVGMEENVRTRLFEPFFTTKEVGKGTGLGLSIVYGIVKQHGGFTDVTSEQGVGTSFSLYLPMIKAVEPKKTPVGCELPAGGTETILVVDDDASLRELSRKVLVQFGYTVITAEDGRDAVNKFRECRDTISLILLDIIMPKMNGKEALEEIRKLSPESRIIFISGYSADIVYTRGMLDEGFEFLSKPISPVKLLQKVREVLDR